jgi:hypothetical protein
LIFQNLPVITGKFSPFTENLLLPVNEILYRTIITNHIKSVNFAIFLSFSSPHINHQKPPKTTKNHQKPPNITKYINSQQQQITTHDVLHPI